VKPCKLNAAILPVKFMKYKPKLREINVTWRPTFRNYRSKPTRKKIRMGSSTLSEEKFLV
jgi:hypothetical protein